MKTSSLPFARRRWVRIALGAAIAGNLLGAGGAMYLLGDATDLTVDEAIRRFRETNTEPTSPANVAPTVAPTTSASTNVLPRSTKRRAPGPTATATATANAPAASADLKPGVYVYATDGYEETDALSGQRHDYPSQTTITVSRHACGYRFRWQPLEERWDQSDTCRNAKGIVLVRFAIYHEFFHRSATEDFAPDANAVVLPNDPVAGDSWRWTGTSNDSAIDTLTTVIGFDTIDVGGKRVRTVHLRYETAMSGDNDGTQVQDRWHTLDTGLLIRLVNRVDAKVEVPFGGTANYTERYRIDLRSLEPEG